ncbi:hypothetical protein D9C73_010434 [Collichthys lucidus]|uniref:Uncharacterized protein n=1 Tax=Collichthys lucidus TaxID=240159 RepID=A0A4U5UPD2_COLLU|nr:hypothetical protein D9C73_010434 [Collichthys lucidus]
MVFGYGCHLSHVHIIRRQQHDNLPMPKYSLEGGESSVTDSFHRDTNVKVGREEMDYDDEPEPGAWISIQLESSVRRPKVTSSRTQRDSVFCHASQRKAADCHICTETID